MQGIKLKTVIHGSLKKSSEYYEAVEGEAVNPNYKVEEFFTCFFEVSKPDHLLDLIRAFRSTDVLDDETPE